MDHLSMKKMDTWNDKDINIYMPQHLNIPLHQINIFLHKECIGYLVSYDLHDDCKPN